MKHLDPDTLLQVTDLDGTTHAASTKAICSVSDCGRPVKYKGVCWAHYSRMKRKGTYELEPKATLADHLRRLEAKVEKTDTCWLWTGSVTKRYGVISIKHRGVLVHRFAYEAWVGPIPDGYEVDHVYERGCRSTLCVNPAHLEAVTPEENQRRQVTGSSGVNRRKMACKRGHPFSPDNTGYTAEGYRVCLTCNSVVNKARVIDAESCVNGHPFASEHGATNRAGKRYCRTCKRRTHAAAAADIVRRTNRIEEAA